MELEMVAVWEQINTGLESLAAAASLLESAAARLEAVGAAQTGEVGKITAAIESAGEGSRRELEQRLSEAERALAMFEAAAGQEAALPGRKTLPAPTVQLLAKQGIDAGETTDLQSLDAALAGLSVEQRIAVKAQMLRTGALTL